MCITVHKIQPGQIYGFFQVSQVSSGVENSTCPLVSKRARQCKTRKDIPGTHPTAQV